jgi:hypothetical protein
LVNNQLNAELLTRYAAFLPMNHFANLSRRLTGALLLAALLAAPAARAQTDPGSGGPTPGAQEPTAVPLDGGAALLLLGGAAYTLRQLRARRLA